MLGPATQVAGTSIDKAPDEWTTIFVAATDTVEPGDAVGPSGVIGVDIADDVGAVDGASDLKTCTSTAAAVAPAVISAAIAESPDGVFQNGFESATHPPSGRWTEKRTRRW